MGVDGGCDILYACFAENKISNSKIFLRYVVARVKNYQRDMAYRIYISDCLKMITQNTAIKEGDAYMNVRYYDIISNNVPEQDNKTGDEIAIDVITRAGLEVV